MVSAPIALVSRVVLAVSLPTASTLVATSPSPMSSALVLPCLRAILLPVAPQMKQPPPWLSPNCGSEHDGVLNQAMSFLGLNATGNSFTSEVSAIGSLAETFQSRSVRTNHKFPTHLRHIHCKLGSGKESPGVAHHGLLGDVKGRCWVSSDDRHEEYPQLDPRAFALISPSRWRKLQQGEVN